ncbi:hypothetical protein M413DRAFT_319202 [Hebeloma cylindrosporum]|uniref:Uncharacterized protein n=1 Tax=Hebeloma cylindrosporum TaxID=76867 RepID=A0A0C3BXT3_HEBCY|nr:hypothetical protein M413DRAFT_319202 [Hebeloma cylindrosporum h7]
MNSPVTSNFEVVSLSIISRFISSVTATTPTGTAALFFRTTWLFFLTISADMNDPSLIQPGHMASASPTLWYIRARILEGIHDQKPSCSTRSMFLSFSSKFGRWA